MHYTTKALSLGFVDSAKGKESYVILFTEEFGRIIARTSGMQKLHSKKRLYLQGNYLLEVVLYQKKSGNFYMLSELTPLSILLDYVALPEGVYDLQLYMMLLKKLLPDGDPEPQLFLSVVSSLSCMQSSSVDAVYVWTVVQILKYLGYGAYTNTCMHCQKPFDEVIYTCTHSWLYLCTSCAQEEHAMSMVSKNIVKYIMVAFTMDFQSFSCVVMQKEDCQSARMVLEQYIQTV